MKKSKQLFFSGNYLLKICLLAGYFLLLPALAFSQNQLVTGTVTEDSGEPLIGVSIMVKGTSTGTVTDLDGKYAVEANENATLVFSYIGYTNREIAVRNQKVINVILGEDTQALDEVIVVGYGTQRKRDITGSVASVNSKDFQSLSVTDIGEALQGRAAGVQVYSSGEPGSNVTIRVRGTGTINESGPPLVIDGVPTDLPLNTLSQDDIASVEILKDASASAIYGSRGANGVLLVTTKRGRNNTGQLAVKASWGVQQVAKKPSMLNATQFAGLNNEMIRNNGQELNPAYANPSSLGVGTDWIGALFENALIQNYSVAYSGGNEKSSYYVSGAVLDQKGVVLNTDYKRYTFQFNGDAQVKSWLKFSNNITFNHDTKKSGDYGIRETMAANPVIPIYNEDGTYAGPTGAAMWYGDIINPIGLATINKNQTEGYNLLGNITAEITFFKGLKFRTMGSAQVVFWDEKNWIQKYDFDPISVERSALAHQYNKSITYLWDNFFTYDTVLKEKHSINALLGSSAQKRDYNYLRGSVTNFTSDLTQQMNNGTDSKNTGGTSDEWAMLSWLGRVNYSYDGKYLATVSLRRDGSSRFGKENRWGWFPSGSVAWRIGEESFMENVDWLANLKLRAGYGHTGNENIGNYMFSSVYQTYTTNFNNIKVPTVVPNRIPNPGIKWETVKQTNVGIDFSVLQGRVDITLDGYIKNTSDMLVPLAVPASTGYSDWDVPQVNAGKMQNKGFEVSINSQNITGTLNWSTQFNFSYNKNKIVSLNSDTPMDAGGFDWQTILAIHNAGYPAGSFYGFVTDGIFQTQEEVDKHAVQIAGADPYNRTSPGDIRFRDLNNDGKIDDADRTYIGNPNPDFTFAMNNTFLWKGFDLSIFLQGVAGVDIYNANLINQEGMLVAQNQTTAVLDRWTGEGTSNSMPRAVFNDPNKNTRVSDRFIENGSYLRIKSVVLGYTIPKKYTEKAKIGGVRLYLSGQNLYTFTKYSGFDPEVPASGIDNSVYPVTRTISGGINFEF